MGILVAAFWIFPQFSSEWRLFLVTRFLGALTTFSLFSGEVIELFFKEEWVKWVIRFELSPFTWLLNFTVLGNLFSLGSSVFYSISDKIAKFFRIKSMRAYTAKFLFTFGC